MASGGIYLASYLTLPSIGGSSPMSSCWQEVQELIMALGWEKITGHHYGDDHHHHHPLWTTMLNSSRGAIFILRKCCFYYNGNVNWLLLMMICHCIGYDRPYWHLFRKCYQPWNKWRQQQHQRVPKSASYTKKVVLFVAYPVHSKSKQQPFHLLPANGICSFPRISQYQNISLPLDTINCVKGGRKMPQKVIDGGAGAAEFVNALVCSQQATTTTRYRRLKVPPKCRWQRNSIDNDAANNAL